MGEYCLAVLCSLCHAAVACVRPARPAHSLGLRGLRGLGKCVGCALCHLLLVCFRVPAGSGALSPSGGDARRGVSKQKAASEKRPMESPVVCYAGNQRKTLWSMCQETCTASDLLILEAWPPSFSVGHVHCRIPDKAYVLAAILRQDFGQAKRPGLLRGNGNMRGTAVV